MKSCNRVSVSMLLFAMLAAGCDGPEPADSQAAQTLSCTAGCMLSPMAPNGAPEGSAVVWNQDSSGNLLWSSGTWDITLPMTAGDAIASVAVTVRDNGPTDGSVIFANLVARTASGSTTSLANMSSTGSGLQQTRTLTLSTPHVVASGETVLVQMTPMVGGALPHVSTIAAWAGTTTVTAASLPHDPTLSIHGSAFQAPGASYTFAQGLSFGDVGGGTAFAPIVLPVGDQILAVRVFIRDSAVSPTHLTARLASLTSTGGVTVIASSSASLGNQTNQTLTITPPVTTIANRTGYTIAVSSDNSDSCDVFGAEVDYQ